MQSDLDPVTCCWKQPCRAKSTATIANDWVHQSLLLLTALPTVQRRHPLPAHSQLGELAEE